MGSCFSKKHSSSSSSSSAPPSAPTVAIPPHSNPFLKPQLIDVNKPEEKPPRVEETVKKEIFVIKQRKSHERRPEERPKLVVPQSPSSSAGAASDHPSAIVDAIIAKTTPVRTSSCTKEEVDAILIQCGRLSRSSSDKVSGEGGARKYSGSKRSYDFDQDKGKVGNGDGEQVEEEGKYSRSSHRRTPSRERDGESKRSGSRHRSPSTSREEERKRNGQNGGSTSRRLSRSPGRRSETSSSSSAVAAGPDKSRGPAKMVSVPASTTGAIKRVSVKRATASPRSQSPANVRENAPSLSRSSSRKDENSPYRRVPLSEIDDNCVKLEHHINKKPVGTNNKLQICKEADQQGEATKKTFHFRSHSGSQKLEANVDTETLKQPQTITRSRSSRRSRDLDFLTNNGDDTLVNVPTSYASILLEDIQNFHQKNSNTSFTLPPCVTKACSILDAVADLNSSNASIAPTEERGTSTAASANSNAKSSNVHSKKKNDPFVETEVFLYDDIMEPSIHKYITVRRGAAESGEAEPQESSGSNSVTRQHWLSSSSWEPNSADSTDHWTSSSNTGDEVVENKEEPSLMVHKKKVLSKG